ncbi:FAD/NAD(P)-binding domain-containing protein [Mycena sanguinolenta]|uniref:FAD/NAD(P)-binding domain-containing protein n=1 Tax=Mycena sanguinolenta TaxID=230812 RepID=A0A8H6ZBR2_9AGAR|nr:FAD/NAD(P)-binding domain-containing protein [Mycena sanguinolenta]
MVSVQPLNVAIVGAGIGGVTAAIALRRSGHRVQVFEASQTKTEIGVGVAVQGNAQRILQQFGFSRDNLRPVDWEGTVVFDAKNGIGTTRPWQFARPDEPRSALCHRVDLHDELQRLALGEGEGTPVELHLGRKVVACDPEAGTVTFSNGEIVHADVVIGADGPALSAMLSTLPRLGVTMFRCLLDPSTLNESTDLEWLTEGILGARSIISREEALRMFFMYPCRSRTLINFGALHVDPEQEGPDWTHNATLDEVRAKFHDFNPKFLRILDLSPRSPILKWRLRALPALPTWIRARAALLGDSAHGTVPMLGQAAAMAIEDAAVLGCLLPLGTTREDVPARLEAYQKLRKDRGRIRRSRVRLAGSGAIETWAVYEIP